MAALTFSHIGITVPDLEKAVEFYSKAFGLYVIMGPTEVQHDESAIGQMFGRWRKQKSRRSDGSPRSSRSLAKSVGAS